MIAYKSALLILFGLAVTLYACDKLMDTSPKKLPAKLGFEFAIDEYELLDDKHAHAPQGEQNQARFIIDSGFMVIENIEFDGRRQHGAATMSLWVQEQ